MLIQNPQLSLYEVGCSCKAQTKAELKKMALRLLTSVSYAFSLLTNTLTASTAQALFIDATCSPLTRPCADALSFSYLLIHHQELRPASGCRQKKHNLLLLSCFICRHTSLQNGNTKLSIVNLQFARTYKIVMENSLIPA